MSHHRDCQSSTYDALGRGVTRYTPVTCENVPHDVQVHDILRHLWPVKIKNKTAAILSTNQDGPRLMVALMHSRAKKADDNDAAVALERACKKAGIAKPVIRTGIGKGTHAYATRVDLGRKSRTQRPRRSRQDVVPVTK